MAAIASLISELDDSYHLLHRCYRKPRRSRFHHRNRTVAIHPYLEYTVTKVVRGLACSQEYAQQRHAEEDGIWAPTKPTNRSRFDQCNAESLFKSTTLTVTVATYEDQSASRSLSELTGQRVSIVPRRHNALRGDQIFNTRAFANHFPPICYDCLGVQTILIKTVKPRGLFCPQFYAASVYMFKLQHVLTYLVQFPSSLDPAPP
jgi:hypothetical protein